MIGVEKNREQENVSKFSSRVKIQKEVKTNASVSYKSILRRVSIEVDTAKSLSKTMMEQLGNSKKVDV